jgi:hypothetical protein
MSKSKRRASHIRYLNRFNVDTFEKLRLWSDSRLEEGVLFIKAELKRAKALYC